MYTPEKIVRQLGGSRRLERRHAHALRIHTLEHVPNRAVLAARVHRLQHDQQLPSPFGVQTILQFDQPLAQLVKLLLRLLTIVV